MDSNYPFSSLTLRVLIGLKKAIRDRIYGKNELRELNAYTKRLKTGLGEDIVLSPSQILMFAKIFEIKPEGETNIVVIALKDFLRRLEEMGKSTRAISMEKHPEQLEGIIHRMLQSNVAENGEGYTHMGNRYPS